MMCRVPSGKREHVSSQSSSAKPRPSASLSNPDGADLFENVLGPGEFRNKWFRSRPLSHGWLPSCPKLHDILAVLELASRQPPIDFRSQRSAILAPLPFVRKTKLLRDKRSSVRTSVRKRLLHGIAWASEVSKRQSTTRQRKKPGKCRGFFMQWRIRNADMPSVTIGFGCNTLQSKKAMRILLWPFLVSLVAGAWANEGHESGGEPSPHAITVELFEGVSAKKPWEFADKPNASWQQNEFAWATLPNKYIGGGLIADRSNPFTLRGTARIELPAGEFDFLLRTKNRARLLIDGEVVLEQEKLLKRNADGHEEPPDLPQPIRPEHNAPPSVHHEVTVRIAIEEGEHELRIEALVGGPSLRTEIGELFVAIAEADEPVFRLLGTNPASHWPLTDAAWSEYKVRQLAHTAKLNTKERRAKLEEDSEFWHKRHELARKGFAEKSIEVPSVKRTEFVNNAIDKFVVSALEQRDLEPSSVVDDLQFLRRVSLDVIGQVPSLEEIEEFKKDQSPERRSRLVERLLDDPRWADHWVPYWQDVLAENPNILKASLNNTGPFRWWIYESFLDNKPMDQFATDLILMRGSKYRGGPAGFEMATQNDVPAANKALILSEAFLATNMNCARCHDSPVNDVTQKQLFSIAAMLSRKAIELPKTSTVIFGEGDREPLIDVSLDAGDLILPHWPLSELTSDALSREMVKDASDSREWLAAIVTSAKNERFAEVIANRLWHRYLGRGLVEPMDDWTDAEPSHPRLLQFLAKELVTHDYDLKHVARLILNSQTYQRQTLADAEADEVGSEKEAWFAAATRRRLTAEQLFDSLFAIAGKPVHAETLTMDPEGRRPIKSFLNLGTPRRAWQFSSLSNERDRPALSLPIAQSANDLLKAFGWREARQDAATERETSMTPTQPLVLANGTIGRRLVGLSDDHAVTDLSLYSSSLDQIIDKLYLSFFTRAPTSEEREAIQGFLGEGFNGRIVEGAKPLQNAYGWQRHQVSWSNHLHAKSSDIMLRLEDRAREGDPPTARLESDWRERMEDVLWALVNNAELMFAP